jgi:hypothetical protein
MKARLRPGFLCLRTFRKRERALVGAAEGCDLLPLLQGQDQKIAAFGSSYKDRM